MDVDEKEALGTKSMTKGELVEALAGWPDDTPVLVECRAEQQCLDGLHVLFAMAATEVDHPVTNNQVADDAELVIASGEHLALFVTDAAYWHGEGSGADHASVTADTLSRAVFRRLPIEHRRSDEGTPLGVVVDYHGNDCQQYGLGDGTEHLHVIWRTNEGLLRRYVALNQGSPNKYLLDHWAADERKARTRAEKKAIAHRKEQYLRAVAHERPIWQALTELPQLLLVDDETTSLDERPDRPDVPIPETP